MLFLLFILIIIVDKMSAEKQNVYYHKCKNRFILYNIILIKFEPR